MSSPLRTWLPFVAICLAACQSPTKTMQVKTTSADVSNVARYRTYSHETAAVAPVGYAKSTLTPMVLEKVRARIDVEMEQKGYTRVPSGELVIRISSGIKKVVDTPTGAAAAAGAPEENDWVGALVIDIFERENESRLFHGSAKDELHTALPTDEQVGTAVGTILEPLPSRTLAAAPR